MWRQYTNDSNGKMITDGIKRTNAELAEIFALLFRVQGLYAKVTIDVVARDSKYHPTVHEVAIEMKNLTTITRYIKENKG